MGRRRLVNAAEAKVLFGLPADEDSLVRHYTLETGITAIFVTHDQAEALSMSDQIVDMNGGR